MLFWFRNKRQNKYIVYKTILSDNTFMATKKLTFIDKISLTN